MFFFSWLYLQSSILSNSLRKDKKFLLKDIGQFLITAAGLGMFYFFVRSLLGFLERHGLSVFDFSFAFLSFSLLLFLPLVFYSALVCALSFLFQKEEIRFYRSLPVSSLAVFGVKFFQTYSQSVWMTFLGFISLLAAIRDQLGLPWTVYLTGAAGLLLMLVIPVTLAVIAVIILARFFAFIRVRNALVLAGVLTGSVLVAFIRLMQPEQLVTSEGKLRLAGFIQEIHRPWAPAFPSEWVAGLVFSQTGDKFWAANADLWSLVVSAGFMLVLVFILARLFFSRAWSKAVISQPQPATGQGWRLLLKAFPEKTLRFVEKDLLNLYRDTVERGSLLVLIPLCFVYFYSQFLLYRYVHKVAGAQFFSFIYLYLFNFFYSSVIIAGLSGRWVFPSVSVEGNNFKLIRSAPVAIPEFIRAKFFTAFIPLLLLAELLILGSSLILHLPSGYILASCLVMGFICWGIITIALGFGMRNADFSMRDPLEIALSSKGFLCLTAEMLFVFAVMGLVAVPASFFYDRVFSSRAFVYSILSLGGAAALGVYLANFYSGSIAVLSRKEI